MSLNFVRVSWNVRVPTRKEDKIKLIIRDNKLGWAAKGLGCHLASASNCVRFPNTIYDGTMDALNELRREMYLTIEDIED